jgi:hypothetical protein
VDLERGPLSLVRIIEELLEWKSSGSGQELTAAGIRCADHATLSIRKKLTLTSPTSGGLSVCIVRLRTKGHGVMLFRSNTCSQMEIFVLKQLVIHASVHCAPSSARTDVQEKRGSDVRYCCLSPVPGRGALLSQLGSPWPRNLSAVCCLVLCLM